MIWSDMSKINTASTQPTTGILNFLMQTPSFHTHNLFHPDFCGCCKTIRCTRISPLADTGPVAKPTAAVTGGGTKLSPTSSIRVDQKNWKLCLSIS